MMPALRTGLLAATLALAGCATGSHPKDPLENFNRAMFDFNDVVDRNVLKPPAEAYARLPPLVQTGVGNFFGNLADVWTAANNLLQGKLGDGFSDITRVAVNTVFGLGGLLDIGSEVGLQKHSEDFGQTLGKWGVKPGPYVVLPLFGPSTLRDTAAFPLNSVADPLYHVSPNYWSVGGYVLRLVDLRASVLGATGLLEDAALDRYVFVRDAYLQRRQSQVMDGAPSSDDDGYDDYEEDYDDGVDEKENGADNAGPAAGAETGAQGAPAAEQGAAPAGRDAK